MRTSAFGNTAQQNLLAENQRQFNSNMVLQAFLAVVQRELGMGDLAQRQAELAAQERQYNQGLEFQKQQYSQDRLDAMHNQSAERSARTVEGARARVLGLIQSAQQGLAAAQAARERESALGVQRAQTANTLINQGRIGGDPGLVMTALSELGSGYGYANRAGQGYYAGRSGGGF